MPTTAAAASQRSPALRRHLELGRLITDVARTEDEDDVMRAVARHLRGIVVADRVSVAVIDPTDHDRVVLRTLDGDAAVPVGEPMALDEVSLGAAIASRRTLATVPAADARYLDLRLLHAAGMRHGLVVPLIGHEAVLGSINLARGDDLAFDPDDRGLVGQVADLVSTTLERARLLRDARRAARESRRYAERLEVLNEISHDLTATRTEDDAFEVIADAVQRIATCDRISYATIDERAGVLRVRGLRGIVGGLGRGASLPLTDSIPVRAIRRAVPVHHADVTADGADAAARLAAGLGVRSVLSLPVTVDGTVSSCLTLSATGPHAYDGQVRTVLAMFVRLMGSTLERVHATELLDRQARRDDLTGVANRRAFTDALDGALRHVGRGDGAACLCFIDVDHFKRINDAHGHAAGDAALVAIATRLDAHLRDGDVLGRVGGDEFAVVMLDRGADEAAAAAGRLLREVTRQPVTHGGSPLHVTVSIGVAELSPGMDRGAALRAADEATYRAKDQGRDRVVAAPRDVSRPRRVR